MLCPVLLLQAAIKNYSKMSTGDQHADIPSSRVSVCSRVPVKPVLLGQDWSGPRVASHTLEVSERGVDVHVSICCAQLYTHTHQECVLCMGLSWQAALTTSNTALSFSVS